MGRRLRFQGLEFRLVRIMAVSAEEIGPLPIPFDKISGPFPVDARLPVSIKITVAFAAELITFGEVNEFPVIEPKFIPIFRIMAVEAPSHGFGMMHFDGGMLVFQLPPLAVHFHGSMAAAAGKHSLGKGRGRNRKLFMGCLGSGRRCGGRFSNL
jgi:hypothetical protein